jgi:hypothetical protein
MPGARDIVRATVRPATRLLAALALAAAALAMPGVALTASADAPAASAKADRCVEDTPFMRRNHMELLKHHRDRTVHEGIRTTRHSLANCVACHADKETGSVVGRNSSGRDGFCAGCHSYVGVTLDCFECHATKPKPAVTATAGGTSQ